MDDDHDHMHVCARQRVLIYTYRCVSDYVRKYKKATTQNKFGRRRKKEKENKKKVRHGGLEPPTT